MTQASLSLVEKAVRRPMNSASRANARSVLVALNEYGSKAGVDKPHRIVPYLAQTAHESGEFHYDKELWGPTPAQKRYEDRKDLGHSPAVDGEAFLFRGRTELQLTGRANYIRFRDWCRKQGFENVPDFEKDPDAVLTDPWEGLVPIWYWSTHNLNKYADSGDLENMTRAINGGLNGYADRLELYDRFALVWLDYGPEDVEAFQMYAAAKGWYLGDIDNKPGPKTRAALHKALASLTGAVVAAGPVVENKAVVPAAIDKPVTQTFGFWERLTQLGGLGGIAGLAAFFQDWRAVLAIAAGLGGLTILGLVFHNKIIETVKAIKKAVNE